MPRRPDLDMNILYDFGGPPPHEYCYLIEDEDGFIKIGVSKNPTERYFQLSKYTSKQLIFIGAFKLNSLLAHALERFLHHRYANHADNRQEWFSLDSQFIIDDILGHITKQ